MIKSKRRYVRHMTGTQETVHTGLCQYIKYFWRKVIYYAHAPLHKYVDQVSNDTFHKIIDAFGECIYTKLVNGGVYNLPCDKLGRLYIRKIDRYSKTRDKKHFRVNGGAINGCDYYMLYWDKKKFNNHEYTNILLKNTKANWNRYFEDTAYSNAIYYDRKYKLKL